MSVRQTALIAGMLLITGCTSQHAVTPVAAQKSVVDYPVITRLVGRHQTVTISAGPASSLYSVQSPDGRTLVSFATLDELRSQHPDQFRFLQPVIALETSEAYVASATAE